MSIPDLDPQYYWAIAGILLIILEIGFFGFGFLFLGIGCLLSYIFIQFNLIGASLTEQITVCTVGTVISAIILWKPLKSIIKSEQKEYSNMVGKSAVTTNAGLLKNKTGQVIWSGVKMKAKIKENENYDSIPPNHDVNIVEVKGNILIVKKI